MKPNSASGKTSDTIYSLNGRIVPEDAAVVSVTDRGFLYGDGVFETLHAYGRSVFCLRDHIVRIEAGMRQLHFNPLPNRADLERWIAAAVDAGNFPEANVRLTVTRGSGPRGPSIHAGNSPTVVIMATHFQRPPAARLTQGVRAIYATFRRQEAAATARLKTLNYIEQILAKREADLAGADEALLLNNAGLLCEGSASNIALIRDGVLALPDPERAGALPGIAQQTAIAAARKLKIPVQLTSLSPWDPGRSDEAFLSGSMREITPLVQVGDATIGSGKPGPFTLKIVAEYRRIVERQCKPFKFK